MARVRWIGPEPVEVPELGQGRIVEPDEIVEVPDGRYWGYACQAAWEEIEPPADFVPPGSQPSAQDAPEDGAPLAALGPGEAVAKKTTVKKTTAAKTEPQKTEG